METDSDIKIPIILISEVLPLLADCKETDRISRLRTLIMNSKRYLSTEQADIITASYRKNPEKSRIVQRALALKDSFEQIIITIDDDELIIGNRTAGIRDGVVFPEAGISWLEGEFDSLAARDQDPLQVRTADKEVFYRDILPFWRGKTLEDTIRLTLGDEISAISSVVKVNQKDHAQGHIIPDVEGWLNQGPAELSLRVEKLLENERDIDKKDFYQALLISLEGAANFMRRYSSLAGEMSKSCKDRGRADELQEIARICEKLADSPPETYHEALQSVWFLFTSLQMESNASSFSPGRIDQYLYPFFAHDIAAGRLDIHRALELTDALFLSFNKIVYMRSREGAKYFAGFPIGFNISLGGSDGNGNDSVNALTYIFLKAQEHLGLPQPNMTARLFKGSDNTYIDYCSRIIGLGSGMPQIVNDESIIPALERVGITHKDAADYGLVGCVELSTQGNNLGWSDAAMFNLVKALELALNNGTCLLTGKKQGPDTGSLAEFNSYEEVESALTAQIDYFLIRMMKAVEYVDKAHAQILPSPLLSSVIKDCIDKGMDVTAGGAKYNLSGIQAIQIANLADSLAVIRQLVYVTGKVSGAELLKAMQDNWAGKEFLHQEVIHRVPKYGNDVDWVDEIGSTWSSFFADSLGKYRNARGGIYHMGLYTVSAHVPMGAIVGAGPDGRKAGEPLADGGVSPMYGRDLDGPTAVLKSAGRLNYALASNGTLLNMKFLPSFFADSANREKFNMFLRTFIRMGIHHIQFNVVNKDDLIKAQEDPDSYRNLTIRVAGYTAYFTELAEDLQNEIIERTEHGV